MAQYSPPLQVAIAYCDRRVAEILAKIPQFSHEQNEALLSAAAEGLRQGWSLATAIEEMGVADYFRDDSGEYPFDVVWYPESDYILIIKKICCELNVQPGMWLEKILAFIPLLNRAQLLAFLEGTSFSWRRMCNLALGLENSLSILPLQPGDGNFPFEPTSFMIDEEFAVLVTALAKAIAESDR